MAAAVRPRPGQFVSPVRRGAGSEAEAVAARLLRRFDVDRDGRLSHLELSDLLLSVLPGGLPPVDAASFAASFPGGAGPDFVRDLVYAMGPSDRARVVETLCGDVGNIEFVNLDTHDLIRITGAAGGGLQYFVNGGSPRPAFRKLQYTPHEPSDGTSHVIEFADIGRACRLPPVKLPALLSDLRRLCDAHGVEHNINDACIAVARRTLPRVTPSPRRAPSSPARVVSPALSGCSSEAAKRASSRSPCPAPPQPLMYPPPPPLPPPADLEVWTAPPPPQPPPPPCASVDEVVAWAQRRCCRARAAVLAPHPRQRGS
eukprot:TRINITY_DN2936_c0_g1_i1.p1 TRINITY_DN2936_c0_g1~~TRINITY_DN2936_c0_g1_i1.p1  ORF type:complete len:330 (+),score=122.48 TRINITY_DN2936_c0_g1_i1:47-991(+)